VGPVDDLIVNGGVGEAIPQQFERTDGRVVLLGVRITAEDMVASGGVEVDFDVVLVGVKGLSLSVAEIILPARAGRSRLKRGAEQRLRDRVKHRHRNLVVKERHACRPGDARSASYSCTRGTRIIELVGPVSDALDCDLVVTNTARESGCA
jgi:hypothetical protein